MPRREIERFLVESRGLGDSEASLLSRLSDGCIGWALMASVEDSNIQQRNQRLENLKPLLMADWDRRFSYAAEVENDRNAALEMIKAWLVWWRDIMLIKCDCKEFISNVDAVSTLEKWAQVLSLREIGNFIDTLQKSLNQISRNANLRLVFEVLMLDMPRKEE